MNRAVGAEKLEINVGVALDRCKCRLIVHVMVTES